MFHLLNIIMKSHRWVIYFKNPINKSFNYTHFIFKGNKTTKICWLACVSVNSGFSIFYAYVEKGKCVFFFLKYSENQ